MLSPGRFEGHVLHRCPQPLQPLVEELHGLFFNQHTADVAAYVMAVEPKDFLQVCRRQLARLKQKYAAEPSRAPARGALCTFPRVGPRQGRRLKSRKQ